MLAEIYSWFIAGFDTGDLRLEEKIRNQAPTVRREFRRTDAIPAPYTVKQPGSSRNLLVLRATEIARRLDRSFEPLAVARLYSNCAVKVPRALASYVEKAGCAPEVPGSAEPNVPRLFDAACFLIVV
jgi:hypothetical protein